MSKPVQITAPARFRTTIEGIFMEPAYKDGMTVEFEEVGAGTLKRGHAYIVRKRDGTELFRTLIKIGSHGIKLAALNQDAEPGSIEVLWNDLAMIARAVWIVQPPPPPRVPEVDGCTDPNVGGDSAPQSQSPSTL